MSIFFNILLAISCIGLLVHFIIGYIASLPQKKLKIGIIAIVVAHGIGAWLYYTTVSPVIENDAYRFFIYAKETTNFTDLLGLGSAWMSLLLMPFVKIGIQYGTLCIVFSCISLWGILKLTQCINFTKVAQNKVGLLLFFLLPSLHFWTGAISKEALLLPLMVMLLYKINTSYFNVSIAFIFLAIMAIRPHVFMVLFIGWLLVYLTNTSIAKEKRLKVAIVFFSLTVLLVPLLLYMYVGIQSFSITSLTTAFNQFFVATPQKGNTAIHFQETSYLMRIMYNLYMPLPLVYPLKTVQQWLVAFEGVYFIGAFIYVGYKAVKKSFKRQQVTNSQKYALICGIGMVLLISSYVYNLGWANRMRMMYYPYLFYFFITFVSLKNEKKIN